MPLIARMWRRYAEQALEQLSELLLGQELPRHVTD